MDDMDKRRARRRAAQKAADTRQAKRDAAAQEAMRRMIEAAEAEDPAPFAQARRLSGALAEMGITAPWTWDGDTPDGLRVSLDMAERIVERLRADRDRTCEGR